MPDTSTASGVLPGLPELPHALRSAIPLGDANTPIPLYAGPVVATQNGKEFRADASITMTWLPLPRVRFRIPAAPKELFLGLENLSMKLEDETAISYCTVTGSKLSNGSEGFQAKVSGLIGELVVRPKDREASYVMFLVPNFDAPLGEPITYPKCHWAARLVLAGSGWKITLDAADNQKEVLDFLKANSGFGVTQVGRLERENGECFTAEKAQPILNALASFISFSCGRWTGPCLPTGFAVDGTQVWQAWDYKRIVPYLTRLSWMDTCNREHFEAPFPGFLKLWLDDNWEEVIRLAIHWYIEANAQAGSIEGSIVLTQTAFELLSSAVLVENYGGLSPKGYDALVASDRIRQLLLWAGIPTAIPPEAEDLTQLAKRFNWSDTSTAMTAIRNTITHPTRKNREKFAKHTNDGRLDAWSLGLWNLELCLLRLFDYHGTYGSRLKTRYSGGVVPVPWSSPAAPAK
jgi:hypothetical protein